MSVSISKAMKDVMNERQRQLQQEKFTLDQDDRYQRGELAAASSVYAQNVQRQEIGLPAFSKRDLPSLWPWSDVWWKPKSKREDLVRAAALLLAELERIDRQKSN